jgi:hypothetical protein
LFLELLWILCSEVMHCPTLCTTLLDVRVTLEILLQSFGNILALGDDSDATGDILMNLRQ